MRRCNALAAEGPNAHANVPLLASCAHAIVKIHLDDNDVGRGRRIEGQGSGYPPSMCVYTYAFLKMRPGRGGGRRLTLEALSIPTKLRTLGCFSRDSTAASLRKSRRLVRDAEPAKRIVFTATALPILREGREPRQDSLLVHGYIPGARSELGIAPDLQM